MTDAQKREILNLKNQGSSYRKIAALLSLSENTIKSFLRREQKRMVAEFARTVIKNWSLFQSIEQRYFARRAAG